MALFLYDDPADTPRFLPFTQSRPIGELRYGAWLLRERIARVFGPVSAHLSAGHLHSFVEVDAPPVAASVRGKAPHVFLRSTFVPEPQKVALTPRGSGLRLVDSSGAIVGVVAAREGAWSGPANIDPGWPALQLKGKRLDGVWQIIADLSEALLADLAAIRKGRKPARAPKGCTVLGAAKDLLVERGATVEPGVVLDTRSGPIWLREQAEVRAGVRLSGPLVVGPKTWVVDGQIRTSSIGPRCIVHGEVSNTVFLGYANKSHEGFLGHSLVGRWVNLGAGTTNSNLKNTYGPVRLDLGAERIETGMMFMGALIGDHAKTAIGTMLPTGCVIGTGANVFGSRRPDARVPAFAWGTDEANRLLACRMFLQTASRVLPRRDVAFSDSMKAYLTDVWTHATGKPCD